MCNQLIDTGDLGELDLSEDWIAKSVREHLLNVARAVTLQSISLCFDMLIFVQSHL